MEHLVQEQAALRRIATLVASGVAPRQIFDAVTAETKHVLAADVTALFRYESDDAITLLSQDLLSPVSVAVGDRLSLHGDSAARRVRDSGRPARMEAYAGVPGDLAALMRENGYAIAVGAPIVVQGRLWGVAIATWAAGRDLPDDAEERLAQFSELTGTAIANAESRDALGALAAREAALRRVATLIAGGATPEVVFDAVSTEALGLLRSEGTALMRYEGCGALVLAQQHRHGPGVHVGSTIPLDGDSVSARVLRTGRPARLESYEGTTGSMSETVRDLGYDIVVGAPIGVEGRLWGVLVASWAGIAVTPADAEAQLTRFTDLVAMAISNAESRAELTASRARIVLAADDARRRIQRNLHDSSQQRLVSLALDVRTAQTMVRPGEPELAETLKRIAASAETALDELQDIARGLHPAALSRGGLVAALRTLVRGSAVPVALTVEVSERLPEPLETAAYYIVSEALTNAAKHAQASGIDVTVRADEHDLVLLVCDDGVGGADATRGSGLIGLHDRIEALGGSLDIVSPAGEGTRLTMRMPIPTPRTLMV
ncbi:MAG TPA: GAF domain-containing sensor histidine kinase [Baekduia sp.]|nr:GAF domain-containing sensor histidine kinase [Baekduia sp.]